MYFVQWLPLPLLALLAVTPPVTAIRARDGVELNIKKPVQCGRPTQKGDKIKVDYRGRLQSTGSEFDNSYDRGKPFEFTLGARQVIQGWDMALLDMCPGEERELTIPPELAYGHRATKGIPADSTLIFDTVLREIVGVKQPESASSLTTTTTTTTPLQQTSAPAPSPSDGTLSSAAMIATPSASPIPEAAKEEDEAQPVPGGPDKGPLEDGEPAKKRCQLLGPFALLVQGALGGFAILTLVWKRYREKPQRPWKIWFFDVSKQVFGSMLTHVLNVGMSMLSSVQLANHAEKFGSQAQAQDESGHYPNPCSFYLLNLAIDTTLGIPVLWILLIVVHALFLRTPLARPPQSLKSGNYGQPPKWTWYLKQLFIYFIGLTGMKFAVFLLFSALPWLPWVGDWALRWTQFDERLEIAFAMFIFPLLMNAVQYYIIDNLIMDKHQDTGGYQAVQEDDERAHLASDGSTLEVDDDDDDHRFKLDEDDDDDGKDMDTSPVGSSTQRETPAASNRDSPNAGLLRSEQDVARKLK